MFIRSKCFLVFSFLFFLHNILAQDTLYVHQELIVYDTIYIKAKHQSSKINAKNIEEYLINKRQNFEKERLKKTVDEAFTELIQNQNTQKKLLSKTLKTTKSFAFYIKTNMLLIDHNLLKNESSFDDTFLGLGLDFNYQFKNNVIIGMSPMLYYGIKKSLKASEISPFEGFYFINQTPFLIQSFEINPYQWLFPIYVAYTYKKMKPSVGFFYQPMLYKTNFLSPNDDEVPQLNKVETFKNILHQWGFLFGFDFQIFKKITLQAQYLLVLPRQMTLKPDDPKLFHFEKSSINMFSLGFKFKL